MTIVSDSSRPIQPALPGVGAWRVERESGRPGRVRPPRRPPIGNDDIAVGHAERFMRTLQEAEPSGGAARLAALFSDDSEPSKLSGRGPHRGSRGARAFWREYLDAFRSSGRVQRFRTY